VIHTVDRTGTDGVRMSTVDLRLISVRETGLASRTEIQTAVALVIDLDFRSVTEVLVRPLRTNQQLLLSLPTFSQPSRVLPSNSETHLS
jgi:hypothetical protein